MNGHRSRYREIVAALSRHGLGYLVGVAGLERRVPFERGLLGHERREAPYTRPEHVRLALEELGATFVKLGQILSTRADLLAPPYLHELAKLQDAATHVPAAAIGVLIAEELGPHADGAFATFELEPLAAASIGQAHAATLHDGSEVVVKLRRPGVVEQVAEDLEILRNLAQQADRHWTAAADYDVVGLVDEFAQTLQSELDYLHEARSAERFAANFADDETVHIPRVFWETTTSRMLTLERVRGIKVDDGPALDAAGIDRSTLAALATRVSAQMIFEDGFFHADPHPGNFFVEGGGRLGIIDFGMVGELDDVMRERLGVLLVALSRQDPDRMTAAVIALSATPGAVDRAGLRSDLAALVADNAGRTVGELHVGALIEALVGVARHRHLQLPHELALLLKMLVMNQGMAATLDPEFQLGPVLAPYAQRLVADQLSPAALGRRLGRTGIDAAQFGAELPDHLRRLVTVLEAGGPEVHLRGSELEPLMRRAERIGERLAAAIIAAALINGLAVVVSRRREAPRRPPPSADAGA